MKNPKIRINLLFLPLFLFFTSCFNEQYSFASMESISKKGWFRQDSILCQVMVDDTVSLYHIDITGRSIGITSISVVVDVIAPEGEAFCDTVSFKVTRDRNSLWDDFRFPWYSHIRFSETGKWQFSFRHNMDSEIFKGMMAIGVYFEKERYGKK